MVRRTCVVKKEENEDSRTLQPRDLATIAARVSARRELWALVVSAIATSGRHIPQGSLSINMFHDVMTTLDNRELVLRSRGHEGNNVNVKWLSPGIIFPDADKATNCVIVTSARYTQKWYCVFLGNERA